MRPFRFFVTLLACAACGTAVVRGGGLEARVAFHNGRPAIWVNGQPLPPLMYSGTEHSRDTWQGRPHQSLTEFGSLGYRIIQTDFWLKYSLREDGTFDWPGVRKQLDGILDAVSNAMIVARINVSAPPWWLHNHPDEICRVTFTNAADAVFSGNRAESLASDVYAAFARDNLKRFVAGLAALPEGDRVIGFHIGGGVYGEWHYYGIYREPDASAPMRGAFRAFALKKYGALDRINAAWRTAFRTPDELVVPPYARRYETSDGDFLDPQKDRWVMDYYACQHAVVADLVTGLAKTVKESWPRPALVGLFYGYFFGGWTVGAQASQADIETLFRCPYVDYFAGPYASRSMFGSGMPRTLTDSVLRNGKLWMTEHDGGTHLGNISHSRFPNIPENEAQSVARMRRNFMYALTDGIGQWWYDFGPDNRTGWWSTPRLLAEAKRLYALSAARFEQPYVKPADTLFIGDMASFDHMRPAKADRLTFAITETVPDELLGTGASVDRTFLTDLSSIDWTRYKLIVFGNVFSLNAEQRAFIRTRVFAPSRTVVFFSGAGYSDGLRNDAALISDLVGMRIEKASGSEPMSVVSLGGLRHTLRANGVVSLFQVDDPAATVLGTYSDGETAAARKRVNGATVYYFGLPPKTDLPFFQALAREAGVRTYADGTVEHDTVSVGGGIIAIYSVSGGRKTIKPTAAKPFETDLPPFTTRYFDLATGEDLLDKSET